MFYIAFLLLACLHLNLTQQQQQLLDLPHLLQNTSNLSEFTTLLTSHPDFLDILSSTPNITILAPTNDAFTKIPYSPLSTPFTNNDTASIRAILEYHILPGQHPTTSLTSTFTFLPTWLKNTTYTNLTTGQVVGAIQQLPGTTIFTSGLSTRSTLTTPDLPFTNGLLHTLSTFLVPPPPLPLLAPQTNTTAFSGALTSLSIPSLPPTLTIFAPIDSAFIPLGRTLQLLPPLPLANLLTYHLIPPPQPPSDTNLIHYTPTLANGTTLLTLQGAPLTITQTSNSLFVNSARVIQADILLANGVLHLIDNVLSPNATAARPDPLLPTQRAVVMGSGDGGVPFTRFLTGSSVVSGGAIAVATGSVAFSVGDIGLGASSAVSGGGNGSASASASGSGSGKGAAASTTAVGGAPTMGMGRGVVLGGLVLGMRMF